MILALATALLLQGCLGVKIRAIEDDGSAQLTASSPTPVPSPTPHPVIEVDVQAGRSYACMRYQGQLYCWGNLNGRAAGFNVLVPTPVAALGSTVTDFSAGLDTVCAISAGALYCWGEGGDYQLAQGASDYNDYYTPKQLVASGAVHVRMGRYDGCYTDAVGAMFCWGGNYNGEFGRGNYTSQPTIPSSPLIASGVVEMTVGDDHICYLNSSGQVRCAGYNDDGVCGSTSYGSNFTSWVSVALPSSAVQLSGSSFHNCALLDTGATYCWGYGGFGEMGDGARTVANGTPVLATNLPSGAERIFNMLYRTCALKNGQMTCIGDNRDDVLVPGGTWWAPATVLSGLSGVPQRMMTGIAGQNGSMAFMCAVTHAGLDCWGDNYYGQLGNNSTTFQSAPTQVFTW